VIARLTGEEPQWQITEDLDRLKRLAEAGELRARADHRPSPAAQAMPATL